MTNVLSQIRKKIHKYLEKDPWIDINERLPDQTKEVLVCTSSDHVTSTLFCLDKNYFNHACGEKLIGETDALSAHFRNAREYGYKIIGWMDLPEPMK